MYDDLFSQGYLQKDRDTFRNFFFAPGEQGYKNRKALYDDLHGQGYLEAPTYEDFSQRIGLHAVESPAGQPTSAGEMVAQDSASPAEPTNVPAAQQPKKVNRNAVPEWKLRKGLQMAGIGSNGQWQSRVPNPGYQQNKQRVANSLKMDQGRRAGIGVDEQTGKVSMQSAPKLTSYTPETIVNQMQSETGGAQGDAAVQRVREQMPEHYAWLQERMGDDADRYIMNLAFNKAYGDDPDNFVGRIMQKYGHGDAAEQAWQEAEEAARKEFREYLDERNKPSFSNIMQDMAGASNVTGGLGQNNVEGGIEAFAAHMKYHDLKRMSDAAWNRLGKQNQQAIIGEIQQAIRGFYPNATEGELWDKASDMARQYSDRGVYDYAVAMNTPKSATEYFFKKAGLGTTFGAMMESSARVKAGSIGDMQARDEAWQRYEKDHKGAGITGTVASMAIDPLTYASGGIGSLATRGFMWLGGKALGTAAMRRFATTLGGRMIAGAVGGSANLGTFMGGSEAFEQARHGGYLNPNTGVITDYNLGAVAGRFGHGALMGLGTGVVAPAIGNVSDKLVRATESTAGKLGIRVGELGISTVAEGTIFSIPEWIEGKRDPMDVWTDNMAMMAGFKVGGLIKSARQRIEELSDKENPQNMAERNHNRMGFQDRLRKMLDGRPDLALSKDEKAELERRGYADLTELVEGYKDYSETKKQQKKYFEDAKAQGLTNEAARQEAESKSGGIPWNRFTELMEDGSVSEAARAKMYYYLTGQLLPMSTVSGSNFVEHKDANGKVTGYTVESMGPNGVITSKTFRSKKAATAELNRIDRQAELNTIDIGERFYNEKYDSQRMYEACRRMSERTGVPVNSLYNMMKMDAESMSDVEARWAEEVMKEYESLADETFAAEDGSVMNVDGTEVKGLSAIREEIGYRFGVDLDKAIGKDRSSRSRAEQQAVEEYINRLYEEMEREGQEPVAEETIEDRLEMSNRTGYYTPDEGQQDIKRRYDVARQRLRDLGFNDYQIEYLEGLDKQGILDELGEMEGREDAAAEAVREFLDARATYEGMVDRVQDDIESEVQTSDEMVDQQTNKKTGMTQRVTLKGGGEVFIIDGEVNVVNGEIDLANSSNDLVIFNPATGKPDMISINDLESADEPIPAGQVKQENADAIRETKATEASDRIEGVLPFQPGDRYEVLVDESPVEVTVIEDQGENVVVQFAGSAEPTVMTKSMIQDAANALRDVQIAEQAAELGSDNNGEPLQSSDTETPPAVEEEPVIEESVDEDAMPMDGEEVDWFATTPERAHRFLYDEAGLSPEEADAVVVNSIRDAEKELEKVNKKAPKPGNASQLNKYRAEKKDHDQQVAAAQAEVDYWKGVKAIRDQQQAELVRAQAEERARLDAEAREKAAEELKQQQAELAAKRVEAEERGPFKAGIAVIDKWDNAPKVDGVRDQVMLADGTAIPGHYVLVEAGAATPSHDPSTGWKASEGFPVDENGGTVNDRDYERDQAAQDITIRMSETYDSRAAQSVPVVTSDGVVLSGNGRTIAGDLAAQAGTDGAYIDYLKEYGGKYGFNAEQVGAMQHPRVLFVPDEKMPYTAETFAKFNAQEMKGQNLTETAVKLGKTVDDVTFNDVIGLINKFDTMSQFYGDDTAPTQAITMLLRGGVINPMQHAQMFDGDKVSTQGEEMLENLLLGKAFEGNPDAIRQLMSMPSVRQQVVSALAEIANNAALGDYSLDNELSQAIALVEAARRGNIKQGDTVSNYARQMSLFPDETGTTVADYRNAMVLILGDILNGRGKNTLKNLLTLYNQHAANAAAGVGDLFTGGVKSPENILKEAVEFIKNSNKNELKNELKQAVEQRKESAGQPAGSARNQETGEQAGSAVEGSDGVGGTDESVAQAEAEVDTEPTDGQKEAGNYKKGHVKIDGFDVTIEQPKGSVRSGVDASGKAWSQEMHNTYGYIRGTEGVDGDHIDVFLSDHLDSWNGMVYVVDQVNKDGSFDEHKVMYGFDSEQEARDAYLSNYEEGWTGLGNITGVSRDEFKKWVDSSHRKTKPFADYKSVRATGSQYSDNTSTSRTIQGLEGYTEDEILADVRAFIEQQLEDAGIEGVTIKGMALHGSRMRGDARPDSDLDVVVEYEGDISEDSFFNLVNYDLNFRGPNGVIIDINPITRGKSGTLEQYMERSRRYDEEKRAANIETGGAVVDQLKGMGVDVNTDINEYRKTLSDAKKDNSEAGTIKYMRTSDGTVYGFVYRGKINLDPRKIDAELPLHEYGHLWGEALRIIAPDKWRQVVEVLKGDADTWNFLKERKPELTTDDAIADEMIAEFSGKNGEQRLKDELERLSQTNADYKTKWGNIYKNIVKAIQDFWKQVGDFLHIDYKSPQQVYDQVLKDFASGMNPRAKVEKYLKERDAEFVDAVNRGDMEGATRLFNDALTAEVGNGMTPFVSVGGYGGKLRDLARKVKRGDKAAIDEVAKLMVPIIPKDAVLIPAPSHTGRATYMLDVANAIAKITGCDVADVLRGTKRAMQYEQKKQTGKAITSAEMGVTVDGELPAGKVAVVLDNVVATGNTAEACVQALGKGIVCSLTKATDQYDHVASLKSANVVVRDSKGDVIPLSKRFDLSQSKRLGNIQFSKSEGGAEAVSNREAALRDGLVEVLRGAGIEVVTDVEEGQRVLDAVNGRVQAMGFANSREEFDNTRDRAVAETGIVMTGLAEEEVTVVDVPRHDFTGVAPIKQAEAWGKKNLVTPKDKRGNYIDKPKLKDGTEYSISSNAVGKFLSKSATKNSDNLGVHLSVLKKLKDVIHESMEAEVHPDYKKDETGKRDPKNGYNPDYLVHRLYGAVDIDGKTYRVKTTIIENGNESRNYPHSYEVTEIELLDDSMAGSESRSVNIGREGHDTKNRLSNNSIAGAKLLQGVEKSYDPGKKLLDESEKSTESGVNLHRVWHGSGAEFDTFDHSHMGEGEGAQAYGWGTYVTEVEDIGRRYAETAGGVRYKGHDVDELYEHSIDGMEDSERNAAWMLSRAMRTFGFSDAVERLRSLYKQDLEKSNRLKGLSIEQTMERYGCSRADAKRYIKDAAAKADMWQQRLDALEGMREEDFTAPSRVLYEVEIPEESGAVYLDHVALMKDQPDVLESVDNALTAQGWRRQEIDDTPVFTKGEKKIILSDGLSGGELYLVLEGGLGSDRAASEFLHEAGVTGIVYPSNYLGGGNRMGSKNYVIFNEADAQITGREKFFRTADGTAYGFVKDGRIYIDPRIATSETPIHEYGHLWCGWLKKANPKAWSRLCDLMLGQKDVLDYVKRVYPDLEGDALVEEVFNHYSGRRGAERLRREEEAEMAKADGVLNKARIKVIFDKIRRALTRFWELSRDLFAGKVEGIEKLGAEDFADMALADLLGGFNGTSAVDNGERIKDKGAAAHGTARQERTLMGVHNITQEKLRSALKLGGLANPSMAVIDTSVSGFDSFGDISLIPDADLIASKTGRNAGTWGADAYSPRFPETHRRLGKGGDKKMREWIKSLGMRKEMVFNTEEQFNDYYNSFNIRDNALVYPFLHEKGLSDQVDYYTHKNVDSRLEDDLREANGDAFVLLKRFDDDDEYKKKLTDIVVGDEVRKISRKDGESFQEFRDRRRAWAKQIREALTEEDGFISRHLADDLLYSQARAYRENGKFNEGRTLVNAEEYIRDNGLQEEYQQYFEQKMQELGAETQIYAGSDSQGRSKFKPADLDQISRQMKKQGRAGAEGGIFEDSPGAIRAKLLNPMKTLDQIRKEKNRIVDHEQFEQAREQYQEELREYADRYTRGSAGALADIITSGNMAATAQRYNISLDADAVADLNEFKSRIRQMPTEYFETKFERPVMLEEFRKVVVPDDLPLDLYGALDRAGLEIVEYKSGDKEDRRRKMLAATKDAPGIRFHFVGEKGASQADKNDSGNRMDNRAIAEQMEQAGKDARNIKLATGWERGADGKWRYEIMDFDDVDVIGNLEWLERHPDAKRVRELIHKINANLFGIGEPLTKAEQAEYAAIVEKWHGALRFDKPFKNPDRLTLQDYVKADELFAAYPELREMPVKFEELDGETRGVYRPHRKEIAISVKLRYSKDGLRNELLHEVQHAIQHIEGFASGSSEQLVRSAWDNIHGINKTINRLADSLGYQDWIKTLTPEKINAADDLRRKGRWFNLMYVFAKDNFKDPDVRDKFIKKLDEANDVIAENKQVTGDGLTAYQAYRVSAGEVEARNVQSRSNMSREERRVSLAENTEDIPRDKQTVWTGFDNIAQYNDTPEGSVAGETGNIYHTKDGKQVVYRSLFEDLMPENSLFGNQQQETRPVRPMTDAERIQAMSDEELLRQVSEGDVDTGERNFYSDEYDRRHNQEYFKECDRYRQMLEDSNTTEGQAEEMLLDIIRDWRDKFNTPERTTLLAQFDTINDYYSEKVEERMRREEEEEIDRENAKFFEETDDSELTDEERLEKQRLIELGYLPDDSKNRNQSKPEPAPVEAKTASPGEIVEKPKSVFGRPKGRKAQFDPTEMSLRKLDEGEMSNVERRYVESQQFDFTGTDKIESAADVAYIFRQLETSAVENCFLVLIKDGKPTILHIGMGGYAMTVANIGSGVLAASALNPDTVIMLHNHPSGTLKPSAQDISLHKKVVRMFGEEKVEPSIIIDITSGKYAMFTDSELVSEQRPTSAENEVSHQVYSFSKMVFSKDWNPETAFQVKSSEDVAAFVSSHRLGDHDKVSLIVVDHAKHIVGNIFLPWTSLNDKPMREVADQVAKYTHQMGGSGCILYGSGMDLDTKNLKKINSQLSAGDIQLVDCISVENGRNKSYNDYGMMNEPEEPYRNEVHDDSVEPEASDEELDAFKEGFNIQDGIARGLARLAQQNKDKVEARRNAVRAISDNIRQLQSAMRKQRNYDRYTVNAIINTAKVMLDSGLFNGLQRSEVKRLLGMVNASVGREDISRQAEKVVDLLQDHQLREWEDLLQKMLRVKASKTNSSGVQVQGALDIEGQRMVQSFKEHMDIVSRSAGRLEDENGDDTDWGRAIKDCEDRMSSNDPVVAKNAQQEYDGILLAQQWYNEVVKYDNEIKSLKAELRDAQKEVYDFERIPVTDEEGKIVYRQDGEPRTQLRKRLKPEFGGMDENGNRQPVSDENKAIKKNLKGYERSVQASIRDIKEEQVEGYRRITDAFGQGLNESARRAKEWRDAQVERVNDIHHNINSDIEGRPAKSQPREVPSGLLEPTVNNTLLKPIQLPAQTFEKILRYLGKHAYNGEGYLFNRFVPGYMRASNQEFERRYEAMQILDEKVREVFGGQHIRRAGVIPVGVHLWRQLYDLEKDYKRFPPIKVTYWDHGNWVDDELSQGEALYIYMVNKMNDGVMKLRRMGISEVTVERIKQHLDPRFIEIADWLQDEFLPSRRELYSEVYERMYGAPMPAVENYVHLVINKGSIDKDEDINNYAFDATNPSTVTGSVIKRTRNSKPIDIHTDVFDLIARDIDDMEHWAAFAEYNRDLNTMRNYGRLRNALRNVKSVEFGGGQQMLKAFDDACAVVAGSYRPALYHSKLDKWAYEVMRMAVGACIALRNFTAFKQTLSIPSFLSEASAEEFAKHTNPFTLIGSVAGKADWEWAEKNLPGFRKRWLSRQMGDPRMLKSELGLSRSRQRIAGWFSRYGMWLNARVDAAAVATGAHAVYETKKKQYLKEGYTPELAESKALADAWVAYNNSQQSTEGPFVSPVQLDKTSLSMLFTMFRTASMSYSRKNQTAARNLKYRLSNLVNDNDYMRKSIDFMKKLYEREGLGEDEAKERAERMYNRGKYKAVWDMVIYSFILTALWNMGKKFLQVSDCDDEQTRNNAWRDILAQTAFGPVEGWVGGDLVSDVGTLLLTGEDVTARNVTKEQPFVTSFSRIVDQFGRDKYEAACMCVNLLTVTLTGVDPSVITDAFVSIADAFNGDFGAAKEFCIAMYRLNQFPQKQIDEVYIDELGIWGKDIKGTDMGTLARRYADYMRHRNAPYLDWARDDDAVQKANEKYIKKIDTKVKERLEGRGIEWLEDAYVKADPHLQDLIGKAIKKRVVDVEDEALKDLYDNSTNEATRKAAHDELRKRMGAERDPISGDSEYNKVYNRIKTTDDMEADIELAKAQAAAKAAGDRGKEKAIAGARSKLSGIRKGLGRGNDEQVMETLRNVRQKMLDRFVNGEAAE